MTEQEAIEKLNELLTMCDFKDEYGEFTDTELYEKSVEMAIYALETMQGLKRRNMTVEDLENYMQFEDECVKKGFSFNSLLEAREKQIAKKPQEYEDKYYVCECRNVLLMKWEKYNTVLTPKSNGLPYCLACGQKLDWEGEEYD